MIGYITSIPWNNEPAPFGSLSAILGGKIFLGTKKNFEGEKFVLLKKNRKKNLDKILIFFFDFFNIMVPYFHSNGFFRANHYPIM